MSADIPDPRTLASGEDAFKYPVTIVRGMEKKLRRDVDENHEKLRTLVGASYRDLLDTARTIIDVNGQMERVETLLVDIGRRSDSRILDKIAANHVKLDRVMRAQDTKQLALASQLSVLQKCLNVIARTLKQHGSTLLIAKLLVIARLLYKTTSTAPGAIPFCETLGSRLGSLRQRLLRHIDRRLAKHTHDPTTLVEDMTAFSLSTSSTPSDVLKHFQHIRMEAISRPIIPGKDNIKENIIRRIQLFLSTIRDSTAIYPEVYAASLRALGARPLVEDISVTGIDELSFDIHQKWFANDVKNYAPYTRHDELNRTKAEQMFSSWSSHASTILIERIRKDVAYETDLRRVVAMRREILQLWLSSRRSARGLDWNRVFDELRVPFIQQITHLVETASAELHDSVCTSVLSSAQKWSANSTGQHSTSLWDVDFLTAELSDGALAFRRAIVEKRCGRNEVINQLLETYERSTATLDQVHANIKLMKDTRWEDNYGDLGDDDDNFSTSNILSKTDPDELQQTLRHRLLHIVESMQSSLSTQLGGQYLDCSSPSSPGLFVIRALRELRQQIPQLLQHVDSKAARSPFCRDLINSLQSSLAVGITLQAEPAFGVALEKFVTSKHQVQSLWTGSPSLPVQPTPATFKYLRTVVKHMEILGQDLWSLDVVMRLRQTQVESLDKLLHRIATQLDKQAATVDKSKSTTGITEQQQEAAGIDDTHETKDMEDNGEAQAIQNNRHSQPDSSEINDTENAEAPETQVYDNEVDAETLQAATSQLEVDQGAISNDSDLVIAEPPVTNTSSESATTSVPDPVIEITTKPPPAAPKLQHQTKQKQTQLLFDALYLAEAFSPAVNAPSSFSSSASAVLTKTASGTTPDIAASNTTAGESNQAQSHPFAAVVAHLVAEAQLEAGVQARVRRNAREYWRRTYLLFGLLVGE